MRNYKEMLEVVRAIMTLITFEEIGSIVADIAATATASGVDAATHFDDLEDFYNNKMDYYDEGHLGDNAARMLDCVGWARAAYKKVI